MPTPYGTTPDERNGISTGPASGPEVGQLGANGARWNSSPGCTVSAGGRPSDRRPASDELRPTGFVNHHRDQPRGAAPLAPGCADEKYAGANRNRSLANRDDGCHTVPIVFVISKTNAEPQAGTGTLGTRLRFASADKVSE